MYYDEDFYYEPTEFDMQMHELKQSLQKSIKEEYISEMERLRVENEELQQVKKNFEQIKTEYRNKEHQLQLERNELTRTVRKERLSTLMKDFDLIKYKASSYTVLPDKCERCDDKRKISFKSPLGREMHEDCECSVGSRAYRVEEYLLKEFSIDRNGTGMNLWYRQARQDEDGFVFDSSTYFEKEFKEGMKYEDIENYYSTFFRSKEECQKYCEWLTKQEIERMKKPSVSVPFNTKKSH